MILNALTNEEMTVLNVLHATVNTRMHICEHIAYLEIEPNR